MWVSLMLNRDVYVRAARNAEQYVTFAINVQSRLRVVVLMRKLFMTKLKMNRAFSII